MQPLTGFFRQKVIKRSGISEGAAFADGRICTLARNQDGHAPGHRVVAYSDDGGQTFSKPFLVEPGLVTPVVQGSLLRYSAVDQGGRTNRILFSAPGDASKRTRLTVWSSFDETRSWEGAKVIYDGPSAYSDMVNLPGGRIGVLYESGIRSAYERITFSVFDAEFLDAPAR